MRASRYKHYRGDG